MIPLIAQLSGEHPSLPLSELNSILRILGSTTEVEVLHPRLALFRASRREGELIGRRAGYVKTLIEPVLTAELEALGKEIEVGSSDVLSRAATFAVRAVKISEVGTSRVLIENWIGAVIRRAYPHLRVDLTNPSLEVVALVTPSRVYAGPRVSRLDARVFEQSRPGRRPFRHPSALMPRLARCMVNLAQIKIGGTLLDPFAGTGSVLIEAAKLGYMALAIEVDRWIARGCLRNLKHYGLDYSTQVICGDSTTPPLRGGVDAIVTDPPYGRSTKLGGRSLQDLYLTAFRELMDLLPNGARVVTAMPQQHLDPQLLTDLGLELAESHTVRVHSGLTRIICIYKNSR